MNRLLLLPLPLLLAGCLDEQRSRMLASADPVPAQLVKPTRYVTQAPGTEAVAKRVLTVGQQLVAANTQVGIRPVFLTVGAPQPEVFHKGTALEGCQVIVTEGLVAGCKTDDQLAAVLALEMGKIVAEREALASAGARQAESRPSPVEAIGNDAGGPLGSSDGTRRMELAKYHDKPRRPAQAPAEATDAGGLAKYLKPRQPTPAVPPAPDKLAREYLAKAKFQAGALDDVAGLLRKAEDTYQFERQLGDAPN